MTDSPYETGLDKNAANYVPLTPLGFLDRAARVVETAGQKIALPWSAIERIHSSREELSWSAGGGPATVLPLASLFGNPGGNAGGNPAARGADGPLAVLRCGRETGAVGGDDRHTSGRS